MQDLTTSRFLSGLKERGIQIHARDGRLQITAPTGVVDAELREELAKRKPELLAALGHPELTPRPVPLSAAERNGEIPQTPAQQGIWLIQHFSPGDVAYNIPEAFLVPGPVDPGLLQQAVDALVSRHDALRSCFCEADAGLFQSVAAKAQAEVGFTDLSTFREAESEQTLRILIRERAREPFDLSQAPLIRFHLFRLHEQSHVIFFNIHHIIADRRSMMIVRDELSILYQAALRNEPAVLPALPLEYRDYAVWAAKRLADGALAGQLEYWKTKLADEAPFLQMPSGRPYPEHRTGSGATVPVVISKAVGDALKEIGGQQGATMFMTLLAAFFVLLSKYAEQNDLCIGTPFTHRNEIETEGIVGLFVNMLVIRCRVDEAQTFSEFLKQVRTTALEAYENSDLPFQELVRALNPDLRSRRSPLFQVMFGFDSETAPSQNTLIPVDTALGTAKFDLTLQLREGPHSVVGWLEYCTDVFDAASIERLSAGFIKLVGAVVLDPGCPIAKIDLPLAFPQGEETTTPRAEPQRGNFLSRGLKAATRWLLPRSKRDRRKTA